MITIAQRLFGVPLLVHPTRALELARFLGERQRLDIRAAWDTDEPLPAHGRERPYEVVDGIARLPIEGTLVHKAGGMDALSGLTGYSGISAMFDQALEDSAVHGVALMVNSPGGEVAGMFDLADRIYAARGRKPVWAILDESAYSAAYALASAAEVISVPRTGGTGSVGVIAVHTEASRALDQAGITVTVMRYGEKKARANDIEPLREPDLADLQAEIDTIGEEFVALVARNRGIDAQDVRDQQAATFMGVHGVDRGLADIVASPDTAVQLFRETING